MLAGRGSKRGSLWFAYTPSMTSACARTQGPFNRLICEHDDVTGAVRPGWTRFMLGEPFKGGTKAAPPAGVRASE